MREILTRLKTLGRGAIDVKIFGDKVILDEGAYSSLVGVFLLTSELLKMLRTGRDAIF